MRQPIFIRGRRIIADTNRLRTRTKRGRVNTSSFRPRRHKVCSLPRAMAVSVVAGLPTGVTGSQSNESITTYGGQTDE